MKNTKTEYINPEIIAFQLRNLRQIVFEVTDSCNLKCKYCGYGEFYGNYDSRVEKKLSFEKAKLFLDYIINFWKNNPSISSEKYIYIGFYGGEPLLNMDFIREIVSYLKKISIPYKKFQFGMTTNAMLLSKHMDYLVEHNFSLLISLDGNEFNHSYRVDHSGKNSFNRVFSNIQMLQEKHPEFFITNVNFNAVLHNRNSVSETYNYIKTNFNKRPRIAEINTSGIKPERHQEFKETYRNKEESLHDADNYDQLREELFLESSETNRLAFFIHQHSDNVFNDYNELLIDKNAMKNIPTGTCLPFGKKVFITVNGKILPCERIGHNYMLGEIVDNKVLINFDEIAKKYNNWYQKFELQCSKCFNKKSCTKCIFTLPDIDASPVCNQFMNEKNFMRMKQTNMDYLANNPHLYKKILEDVIIKY